MKKLKKWFRKNKDIDWVTDNIIPILIIFFFLSLFFFDGIPIREKEVWEYKESVEDISTRDHPIN